MEGGGYPGGGAPGRLGRRAGNVNPNSPAGVTQRWLQALAQKDLKTLKKLTASKARGDLIELTKDKPDQSKVDALVRKYRNSFVDRALPPRGSTVVVVVRVGSQTGRPVQFVLRREKGAWKLYEIRDNRKR